ncbi:MAG: PilZ domain-containing protein [Gammaproteobacteria bacterium]|nr:MAG: PilZ domain-containing protein [Gammaproteobacteria bacterium]
MTFKNKAKIFTGKEQRSFSRMNLSLPCEIIFEDGLSLSALISNISASGVLVLFEHEDSEIFVNMRLHLIFSIDVKNKIHNLKIYGTAVRSCQNGIGIAFRMEERERLENLIENIQEDLELAHLKKHAGSSNNSK